MKIKTKQLLCFMLSLVLLVSIVPITAVKANATELVTYLDADGSAKSQSFTPVTYSTTTLNTGWYVVNSNKLTQFNKNARSNT